MNLPSIQTSPSSTLPINDTPLVKGECCNCKWKDRWLFHHVVVNGECRRVCTSCVLLLQPSSFCPYCFEFFGNPHSTTISASCVKCSSVAHTRCLPSPSSSFTCPPCSQSNFTFFPVPGSPLDQKLARVLLCASKVASASVNKNLADAKARVEKTATLSAAARKRAKEALVHCNGLLRWHDRQDGGSLEVFDSKNAELGIGTNNNNNNNNNKIVLKKEDFNGFPRGQTQNGPNNRNGAKENGGRVGNRGCNGRSAFDATPKPER